MTNEQKLATEKAFHSLIASLENAAGMISGLSKLMLSVMDAGARDVLPPEVASDVESAIGDAGVKADECMELVRASRDAARKVFEEGNFA